MPNPLGWAVLAVKLLARLGPGGTSYEPCQEHEIRRRNNPFSGDVVLTHHTVDGDITIKKIKWR